MSFKYLGLWIDYDLTWKTHLHILNGKISKVADVLKKLNYLLLPQLKRSIYFVFFHSIMNYASWGTLCSMTLLNIIFRTQIKAIKLTHSRDLYCD